MNLVGKALEVKNAFLELYHIFSNESESERRDEEFTERIKHDKRFEENYPENILKFPQQLSKKNENRDISAI